MEDTKGIRENRHGLRRLSPRSENIPQDKIKAKQHKYNKLT